MNGIKIDTLEKFHHYCNTTDEKIDALFEVSLDNSQKCECRLQQCKKQFVRKMPIKRDKNGNMKYLPISIVSFFTIAALAIYFLGAGIVKPEQLFKIFKTILPFL